MAFLAGTEDASRFGPPSAEDGHVLPHTERQLRERAAMQLRNTTARLGLVSGIYPNRCDVHELYVHVRFFFPPVCVRV